MPGKVVFVGAGPGAADLITLRGMQRLAQADVVLHDALTEPALRALAPTARWVDVGKRGFRDSTGQEAINAMLRLEASRATLVVRLKGGDPSIFGRLEEELCAVVAAGIECEVVPGVTAALAAAAATQRPLTRRGRGRSVALATAMTREGDLGADVHRADTAVFYMAGHQLGTLGRRLIDAHWPPATWVNVVSRAGTAQMASSQHTLATLADAAALHSGQPTVVIVGAGAAPLAGCEDAAAGRSTGAA